MNSGMKDKKTPFRPVEGRPTYRNAAFRLMALCALLTWAILSPCMAKPLVVVVADTEGRPLPHAQVRLFAPQGDAIPPSDSRNGMYRFENVPSDYNALLVKQGGYQNNGFQWFVAQPDTVRMVMRIGKDVVLFDGNHELTLRFDPQRLVIGTVEGASEAAFDELLRECQLDYVSERGYYRWKGGQKIPEFNSDVLAKLQGSSLVDIACTYAERSDRVLLDEFVTHVVEDPKDLERLYPRFLLQGHCDLGFQGIGRAHFEGDQAIMCIDSVLRQYGFRVDAAHYEETAIDLATALSYRQNLRVKSVSGLSGAFLVGQLAQLGACPYVRTLDVVESGD